MRLVRTPLLFVVLLVLGLPANAIAQNIRLTTLDPITQNLTIKNFEAATTIDISSFQMCREPGTYQALSTLSIVAGDLSLSPGEEVTLTYGFVPAAGGGIGLYVSGPFGSAANMLDYMQYMGVAGFRESVAVAAGIWATGTFASGQGPYQYTGDGSQEGAGFWQTAAPPVPLSTVVGAVGLLGMLGTLGAVRVRQRG